MAIYQDFSHSLISYINSQQPREAQQVYKKFFDAPGVFDGLVNILVQELRRSPIRPHLCDENARMAVIDQVVHTMMDKCDEKGVQLHDMAEMLERLQMIKFKLNKSDLSEDMQVFQSKDSITYKMYLQGYHKKCYHHWRPYDVRSVGLNKGAFKGFNTGGLLWGEKGCGKS